MHVNPLPSAILKIFAVCLLLTGKKAKGWWRQHVKLPDTKAHVRALVAQPNVVSVFNYMSSIYVDTMGEG